MDGCPSGQRLEITRADQRAIVVEVGGRIRQYRVGARLSRVLTRVGAPWDGPCCAPVMPWPSRLAGGSYRIDGTAHQVACIEPEARSAINGSSRWPLPRLRAWS